MSNSTIPISVRILDKEYKFSCNPGEEDELIASARHLDKRMREIRGSGKVIGTERIAVMAALNIAHELLMHPPGGSAVTTADNRLRVLREHIEVALNDSNQLEL